MTANFINALDITAKKITVLQTPSDTTSSVLFKADGTGASGSVKIANWTVNNTSLYNVTNSGITAPGGTLGGIWLSTGVTGAAATQIGNIAANTKNWFLAANDKFGVTTGGDIYTKDATIQVQKLQVQRDSDLVDTTSGYKQAFKIDNSTPTIDIKNGGIRYADISTSSIEYTKKVTCSIHDIQIIAKSVNTTTTPAVIDVTGQGSHDDFPYQVTTGQGGFNISPNNDNKATIDVSEEPFRYFITFKLSDPIDVPLALNFMLVAEPNISFQGYATTADALWNENDPETA